ncbi:hypothetical protein BGZ76_003111, partial [Entomortierella beljakovae]
SQAPVDWLKEKTSSDSAITMPDFDLRFEYFTKKDAEDAFSALLSKTFISKKRNEGDNFWATRVVKISKTRTASELVAGNVPIAKEMIGDDSISTASLPGIESSTVLQKTDCMKG